MGSLREKNESLETRVIDLEIYSRKENILIDGIAEINGEDCHTIAQNFFTKLHQGPFPLQRCHRVGRHNPNQTRPRKLIIRFADYKDKQLVMSKLAALKGTNLFVSDDYPPEIQSARLVLRPVFLYLRQIDPSTKMIKDKIQFKGRIYTVKTMSDIPVDISKIGIKETKEEVLFAGAWSPLSNLYSCNI